MKKTYYFFCECCILFLLFVPFINHQYSVMVYWRYLVIAVAVCFLLGIMALRVNTEKNAIFTGMFPVLLPIFILAGFSLKLSFIFAVLWTWRYMTIYKQDDLEREMFYLKAAFIIAAIDMIVMKEMIVFIYACVIFLTLLGGYFASQSITTHKIMKWRTAGYGLILLLGPACLLLFAKGDKLVFWLWDTIITAIVHVLTFPLYLLDKFGVDLSKWKFKERKMPEVVGDGQLPEAHNDAPSVMEQSTPYIKWMIGILLFCVAVIIIIRLIKKKNHPLVSNSEKVPETVFQRQESKADGTMKKMKNIFQRFSNRRQNPVRRIVMAFEKDMHKQTYGRKHNETIEDWMGRVGLDEQLTIYQKVRYGEKDFNKEEMHDLTEKLQSIQREYTGGKNNEKDQTGER